MERISGPAPTVTGAVSARPARLPAATVAEKKTTDSVRRFDTVLISESVSTRSNLERSLCSKITQEVRATGTARRLSILRSQIQDGTYRADPLSIARNMLRMPED